MEGFRLALLLRFIRLRLQKVSLMGISISPNSSNGVGNSQNAATPLRRRVAKLAEIAVDFVLERAGIKVEAEETQWRDQITKHMIVVAACGRRIGCVDDILGNYIQIAPVQGPPILIPLHWVDQVDSLVFLDRDFEEVSYLK